MKIVITLPPLPPPLFKIILPILPTTPFLWEKSKPSIFKKISKTHPPPPLLYKEWGLGVGGYTV